ncbi:MAG: cob(I)yrinic acid a,c-diamide adenosyltransferase [Chloroflexi bacterium]|nr:cob(I)yrinic acid a,c-diamide adenosyltransferase [Chloroflexota bacterium]MYD66379.1 cob(I)yrinic acid a,c-diamide adenosyltransferase [Chloroflexota bacterium]
MTTEKWSEPTEDVEPGAQPGEGGLFPKRNPLVLLYTGDGKGKTSSALGVTMRAWGRGWKICWLQFIKSKTANYGETRAAKRMGIEMIPLGDGFTWLSKDINKDIALARECWALAREKIESAAYDLVVLDEITYPITYGWLQADEVIGALRDRPADVHVIMTGRNAVPGLVEFADLVSEMTEVKHPYQQGIKAQRGIDF